MLNLRVREKCSSKPEICDGEIFGLKNLWEKEAITEIFAKHPSKFKEFRKKESLTLPPILTCLKGEV